MKQPTNQQSLFDDLSSETAPDVTSDTESDETVQSRQSGQDPPPPPTAYLSLEDYIGGWSRR
jgi:hypothetical protein